MRDQKLRGFVGQRLTAARSQPTATAFVFSAGPQTFTVPREGAGLWRFVAWGGGGGGSNEPGGGGALVIKDVYMRDGQQVPMFVGGVGQSSTVTLPGVTLVAGGGTYGSPGLGGTASGGDANVSGSNSSGSSGGGAGSFGEYLGGAGGSGIGRAGQAPGGGAGAFSGTGLQDMGSTGLIVAVRVKAS